MSLEKSSAAPEIVLGAIENHGEKPITSSTMPLNLPRSTEANGFKRSLSNQGPISFSSVLLDQHVPHSSFIHHSLHGRSLEMTLSFQRRSQLGLMIVH